MAEDLRIGAAYIRVSTDEQVEYSPDSQLKLIRDYAKREGYLLPEEFIFQDEGISGKKADKRPAFRMMIAMAKEEQQPFSCIFVWKYSRFARNQEEAIMYKNLLKKRGVEVRSISEPSSDSPFSSLIERIIEWMDEYYVINLAGEVRRGMREKAARGEAMGRPPFGYAVRDKVLVPDENADTVRYVFSQYASGVGYRTIAQTLSDRGVRTARGIPPSAVWVEYILHNPAYVGKIRWSEEGRSDYLHPNAVNPSAIVVQGKHIPLIDTETWDVVQERLKNRRKDRSGVFMLKGLLRCDNCGSTLTQVYQRGLPRLQCCGYLKAACRVSHSISLEKANAMAIAALEQLVQTGQFVFSPPKNTAAPAQDNWTKLIAATEAKLHRAKDAFLDGIFSKEEYAATKDQLESDLQRLRSRQSAGSPAERPVPPDFPRRVLDVFTLICSPDVPELEKNEALRSVVDKILFVKPQNRFDFYFWV